MITRARMPLFSTTSVAPLAWCVRTVATMIAAAPGIGRPSE
jgi:hypothetical protein